VDTKKVRDAFPLLRRPRDEAPIYFDNACTTLKPQPVIDATIEYYRDAPVCGGRSVHRLGELVSGRVREARKRLATFLHADSPDDVVFTRGATESINLVANGLRLSRGDVVVTTDKEHNSNWIPWLHLQKTRGIRVLQVPSKDDGTFDLRAFERIARSAGTKLRLVSVVHASNADGAETPIKEVSTTAHDQGALVLVDGAQSIPQRPTDVSKLGADFLGGSAHKMLGPSGLGFLWGAADALAALDPLVYGGGAVKTATDTGYTLHDVPHRFEAGLQNYAALYAFPAALEFLERLGLGEVQAHVKDLNAYATKRLAGIDGVTIYGPAAKNRGGILPFNVDGLGPHDVALYLDEAARVAVRSGAHCVTSYFARKGIDGWVRASLYAYNDREEVDAFATAVETLTAGVRPTARSSR
jgi:cysteine desulfurase / selenocysteine lyase